MAGGRAEDLRMASQELKVPVQRIVTILPIAEQEKELPDQVPEAIRKEENTGKDDESGRLDEGSRYPSIPPLPPREHSSKAARRGVERQTGLRVEVPLDPPQILDL